MKIRQQIALVFMRLFFVLTIVFFLESFQSTPSYAYDEANFCAPDGDKIIIFVDVTTPFDDRSKLLFEEGILKIISRLSGGQHLYILTIADAFSASEKLFEGCVPFCPEMRFIDWITSDCTAGLIRLRISDQRKRLGAALQKRLSLSEELPQSEIVRTLAYGLKSLLQQGNKVRLYIFSDMIENSQYIPGKIFHSTNVKTLLTTITEDALIPDLNGATVNVFGVGRGGDLARTPLPQKMFTHIVEFWEAYFKAAGVMKIYIGESLNVE